MKNRLRSLVTAATFVTVSAIVALLMLVPPARGADIPYSGEVLKVDAAQHLLIVKNPHSGGRIKFVVTEGTVITAGGEKRNLGDIKTGEAVDIEYALEGGQYIARKIVLKPSGGK